MKLLFQKPKWLVLSRLDCPDWIVFCGGTLVTLDASSSGPLGDGPMIAYDALMNPIGPTDAVRRWLRHYLKHVHKA